MSKASRVLMAVLVAGFTIFGPSAALAEEAPAGGESSIFQDYVVAGGAIGLVIECGTVIQLALLIEGLINLQRAKVMPTQLIEDLEAMIEEGLADGAALGEEQLTELIDRCEREQCHLARVMLAAFNNLPFGVGEALTGMRAALTNVETAMNSKISWQSLLASIATMLGLFGTVFGMIGAFKVIANEANVSAKSVAGQIQVALVTTFQGLQVAIPTLIQSFYFQNRVFKLHGDLATVCEDLLGKFRERTM
ncbi:MAG: MotA/TolQ/ExbB proton channel family protein [Planctomycetes bacterium]|nr:MotA/TolQ/ExbB proton channel family protein [Planctomycetota bacterium]